MICKFIKNTYVFITCCKNILKLKQKLKTKSEIDNAKTVSFMHNKLIKFANIKLTKVYSLRKIVITEK